MDAVCVGTEYPHAPGESPRHDATGAACRYLPDNSFISSSGHARIELCIHYLGSSGDTDTKALGPPLPYPLTLLGVRPTWREDNKDLPPASRDLAGG